MTIVTYVPNPTRPTGDEKSLLGFYKVRFDDGFIVRITHSGCPGTVGAEPVDLEDSEQRAALLEQAEMARR